MQCTWQKAARLNPAQLSRAASQAVRFSLQSNNLSDAFLIVNSLRYAAFSPTPSLESLRLKFSANKFQPLASQLSSQCSPRLASHSLLHGLLRAGMPEKASNLAEQMMQAGIPIRGKTFESIFKRLAESPRPPILPIRLSLGAGQALHLSPKLSSDQGTQHAINLLNIARQSRQRRTHSMFKTLMTLCLVNGEIIVASLLFGILVRDWQKVEIPDVVSPSPTSPSHSLALSPHRLELSPRPVRGRMEEICTSIDQVLSQNDPEPVLYSSALQALANLAYLLDRKLIPFHNITPLLCAMYNCPRGEETVWLPDPSRQVNAYRYFHDVLGRLIHSLPSKKAKDNRTRVEMLPPLDRTSYNSLLHYALRHRRSPKMASAILYHMTNIREEPLQPTETTFNIIQRSATLLRNSRIGQELLETKDMSETPSDSLLSTIDLTRLRNGKLVKTHAFTTSATHLVATGHPEIVVKAIPHILPGLYKPQAHRQEIIQASLLGPVVFTCLLNALWKTGHTGLAERVWSFAQEASEQSWVPRDGTQQVRPWCLPVEAHTIMINIYAGEAKKGAGYGRTTDSAGNHDRVSGWGDEVLRRLEERVQQTGRIRQTVSRYALARYMALQIYRSMQETADGVWTRVEELERSDAGIRIEIGKRQLEVPVPDARFFNAILDVVGRHPDMQRRRSKMRSYGRYLRMECKVKQRYIYRDVKSVRDSDPALAKVAQDMMAHGFEVPVVFRRVLVGRLSVSQGVGRPRQDRRPYDCVGEWEEGTGRTMIPVQHTKGLGRLRTKKTQRSHMKPKV